MKLRSMLICGALLGQAASGTAAEFQAGHAETLIQSIDPDGAVFQARVRFGDLDLRSSAGVRELKARVRRAAGQVCGATYRSEGGMLAQRSACWRQAVQSADPKIEAAVTRAWTIARN
jgi:UrcA family protein